MIDELSKKLIADVFAVMEGKKLDPVGQEDGDVDNDGDKDSTDKYLMKRRDAIQKAMKDEGNAFSKALMAAKEKGEDEFVVAGKKYQVKEVEELEKDKDKKDIKEIEKKKDVKEDAEDAAKLAMKHAKETKALKQKQDREKEALKRRDATAQAGQQ